MSLQERELIGPNGYLTTVEWLFKHITFVHDVIGLYRFHEDNKGPMNFRFDAEYMKIRLQRREYRNQYAEDWLSKLGYSINRRQFWRQRNWRLNLMSYTPGLISENEKTPPFWTHASLPFQRHGSIPWKSANVSFFLAIVSLLPRKLTIGLAHYLFTSRLYGCVKTSQPECVSLGHANRE